MWVSLLQRQQTQEDVAALLVLLMVTCRDFCAYSCQPPFAEKTHRHNTTWLLRKRGHRTPCAEEKQLPGVLTSPPAVQQRFWSPPTRFWIVLVVVREGAPVGTSRRTFFVWGHTKTNCNLDRCRLHIFAQNQSKYFACIFHYPLRGRRIEINLPSYRTRCPQLFQLDLNLYLQLLDLTPKPPLILLWNHPRPRSAVAFSLDMWCAAANATSSTAVR